MNIILNNHDLILRIKTGEWHFFTLDNDEKNVTIDYPTLIITTSGRPKVVDTVDLIQNQIEFNNWNRKEDVVNPDKLWSLHILNRSYPDTILKQLENDIEEAIRKKSIS